MAKAKESKFLSGGRMALIVGSAPVMTVLLITRVNTTEWTQKSLLETERPYVANVTIEAPFSF